MERSTEQRLENLEMKLAYVEDGFDQLNEVVIRQQQQIDRLERALSTAREQLQDVLDTMPQKPQDERPPHY